MVGWVGECCSELGTPIAIAFQSDTKEFVQLEYFRDAATYQLGKVKRFLDKRSFFTPY